MADAIKLYRFDVAGGDLNESSGGERASEAAEIQQGDSDQMRLGDSFQNISCRDPIRNGGKHYIGAYTASIAPSPTSPHRVNGGSESVSHRSKPDTRPRILRVGYFTNSQATPSSLPPLRCSRAAASDKGRGPNQRPTSRLIPSLSQEMWFRSDGLRSDHPPSSPAGTS